MILRLTCKKIKRKNPKNEPAIKEDFYRGQKPLINGMSRNKRVFINFPENQHLLKSLTNQNDAKVGNNYDVFIRSYKKTSFS